MNFKLSIEVHKRRDDQAALSCSEIENYEDRALLALPSPDPVQVRELPVDSPERPEEWQLGSVGVDWRLIQSRRQANQ